MVYIIYMGVCLFHCYIPQSSLSESLTSVHFSGNHTVPFHIASSLCPPMIGHSSGSFKVATLDFRFFLSCFFFSLILEGKNRKYYRIFTLGKWITCFVCFFFFFLAWMCSCNSPTPKEIKLKIYYYGLWSRRIRKKSRRKGDTPSHEWAGDRKQDSKHCSYKVVGRAATNFVRTQL